MQVTQIEAFKFEGTGVECVSQVSGLFITFIDLCDAVSE